MDHITVEDWATGSSISLPLDPGYAQLVLLMHAQLHHMYIVSSTSQASTHSLQYPLLMLRFWAQNTQGF